MMYAVILENGYIDSWYKHERDAKEQKRWLADNYDLEVRSITDDVYEIYEALGEEINGKESVMEFVEELIEERNGIA